VPSSELRDEVSRRFALYQDKRETRLPRKHLVSPV
jgi:hypothetical protein